MGMSIDQLSDAVDIAFRHRDDLAAVAKETERKRDHDAMLRADAKAANLLDRYNSAVRAERRRR
jgi:hypothetical protein